MTAPSGVPAGHAVPATVAEPVARFALPLALAVLFFLVIALRFAEVRALYGGEFATRDRRINRPSCGARTPADADTCDYCGEPVER